MCAQETAMTDTGITNASGGGSTRDRIVDAFLELLGEESFERIGLSDVARRAGVSLAQMRKEFSSTLSILAAHIKDTDEKVLAGGDTDMAEESPREKLFDVLMRRLEILRPHRPAVHSLLRSARRNPGFAFALNGFAVQSQRWMLSAADIKVAGPKGMVRAQGLAMLFACVLQTWAKDDDPGLARTMAVLDRELSRAQRWSGLLDDVCAIPCGFRGLRPPRRRREAPDDAPIAA
jgi:AcrR family transcriptional regulator